MAKKADRKEKKGLLGKALDAVTSRDEKAEAEAAAEQAEAAKRSAAREESKRQIAEAQAQADRRKAEQAQAKAAELEAKIEKMEADAKAAQLKAEIAAKEAEAQERLEAYKAKLAAEAEAAKPKTYVVKSGDSLSKIAKEQLGDASRWPEIHELNKEQIPNANLIRVGQELKLPKA